MGQLQHWAVYIDNNSDKEGFIAKLLSSPPPEFALLKGKKGALFSNLALLPFIEEEARHDVKFLTSHTAQSLLSFSSGERKKALLGYVLETQPDFIILDNPWDNLDSAYQNELREVLRSVSKDTFLVQLLARKSDILAFIKIYYRLQGSELIAEEGAGHTSDPSQIKWADRPLPEAIESIPSPGELLVQFRNITVSYGNRPILHSINWDIHINEFWQLTGPNGSGKSTLLTMITGDNTKAYGQELTIFGQKKGSGESVWDIKKKIGYFTPTMTDRFSGYHSLQNMLLSGLVDSVGLYVQPSEIQIRVAGEWLRLIGIYEKRECNFHDLSMGNQRLIMCARAMIKHPPLLILDEPTAGLDDESAALFVSLVNKMAAESRSAILFVSHREEPGLNPQFEFRLEMSDQGSTGRVIRQR